MKICKDLLFFEFFIGTALRNYVERRSFISGNEDLTDIKLIEGESEKFMQNNLVPLKFEFSKYVKILIQQF